MELPILYSMDTKVFMGELARDVENLMRELSQRLECEIIELNVQIIMSIC